MCRQFVPFEGFVRRDRGIQGRVEEIRRGGCGGSASQLLSGSLR